MWTTLAVLLFGLGLGCAVLFGAAYYVQRRPQQVDPNGASVSLPDGALVVPSLAFVQSMREHVDRRRAKLASLVKASSAELRKQWVAKSESERLAVLRDQRAEVSLAVGAFIGSNDALLQILCPELSDESLEKLAHSEDLLLKLCLQVASNDFRLPAPRGATFSTIEERVASHLKGLGCSKQERNTRASFLPVFRRSCFIALAIALFEAGTKDKERSEERWRFGMQVVRGLCLWVSTAVAMRWIPHLLQSIDLSGWLLGAG